MKNARLFLIVVIMVSGSYLIAQVAINNDGTSPDNSSMLDVKSNNKGILIPRMTQSEIALISTPANGLIVFNTSDEKLYVYVVTENKWKELQYGSGEIFLPASYSIGTGGSCDNTIVSGNYNEGFALDTSNKVNIDATVTSIGTWSINTNTINGYSYSGSGTFVTTGTVQITLEGTGTPVTAQTDNFTATVSGSSSTCTFDITVLSCGSPITYDAQIYNTVQIGTQCWMAENLNIGTMIDGSGNQTNNSIIEKYCYDNISTNCDSYGGLYQWDEIMQYVTVEGTQGVCPSGWHLPTDAEWCILENYVDIGAVSCDLIGLRGTDAGGNLKETGTTHWSSPNSGATNSSGYYALPGGYMIPGGSFSGIESYGYFWSSTEDVTSALCRVLYYDNSLAGRANGTKTYSYSVRCLRD